MVDTHAHLFKEYYENIDEIVLKMQDNIMITSGTSDDTNKEVLELVEKYQTVYGTLGLHPSDIDKISKESFEIIEKNINNPKIVGIGEIGLDYYWVKYNKKEQIELFEKQILLAKKYKKTIVVHSRDSILDTYNIISKYKDDDLKVVIHCFSSSLEMAQKFIKIGCCLGIGGVLTFKNNKKLKEVVKNIDINYLLLETDSPYLTPEPNRGIKNEPYNIIYVAEEIANLKKISLAEVLKITTDNAYRQFDLKV